ncbi:MAG: hypothetical protein RML56_03120 [Burkholderiales bacterium]|nr:hypothetical protein [Burkholderiales bacterium]
MRRATRCTALFGAPQPLGRSGGRAAAMDLYAVPPPDGSARGAASGCTARCGAQGDLAPTPVGRGNGFALRPPR